MHIPDGYISPETFLLMYAVAVPVWAYAAKQVITHVKKDPERLSLIGVGAASAFLIMMFNVPIPGGTSAHAVGGTILAILIGPWEAVISLSITIAIQALVFGDGGILTYGANVINMAIIMPLFGYAIYRLAQRFKHPLLGVFFGSYIGINLAALFVALELGLQPILFHTASGQPLYNPYSLAVCIMAMCGSHLLVVGWIEAFFALVIYKYIQMHYSSLIITEDQGQPLRPLALGMVTLAILTPLGTLVTQPAWGEWAADSFKNGAPLGIKHALQYHALFSGYRLGSLKSFSSALIISLLIILLAIIIVRGIHYVGKKQASNNSAKEF